MTPFTCIDVINQTRRNLLQGWGALNLMLRLVVKELKVFFFTPLDVRSAPDGCPTPQKWSERASSDRSRMPDRLSLRQMSPTSGSSTNPMVFHGVPSNDHSFVWFGNNIHSINSTKLHWKERQSIVKELNSELSFFGSYGQRWAKETQVRHHWLAPK